MPATHQSEAACAVPHLEVVDDCSGQAGHRVEQAAVGDHKVDLLGPDACTAAATTGMKLI
jgi:hypothetical protein